MKILKWAARNIGLIVLVIAGIFFVVTTRIAWGGDDCRGRSCNDGGDIAIDIGGDNISVPVDVNVIGGDTLVPVNVTGGAVDVAGDTLNLSTGGNKAYNVAAPGLGDVDIAQCLGSTQWSLLVGGKQKLVLNQVCMAEFYLKQGRYALAAQALCNQPEILVEYETELACEDSHDFSPPEPAMAKAPLPAATPYEHYEDIEQVQMAQSGLVSRVDQLERKASRQPPVIVEQRPTFSKEQIAGVWEALGEDEDDE